MQVGDVRRIKETPLMWVYLHIEPQNLPEVGEQVVIEEIKKGYRNNYLVTFRSLRGERCVAESSAFYLGTEPP